MPLPMLMPMTPDDLDEIMVIERQSFTDAWTRRMYGVVRQDLAPLQFSPYVPCTRTYRLVRAKVRGHGWNAHGSTGDRLAFIRVPPVHIRTSAVHR